MKIEIIQAVYVDGVPYMPGEIVEASAINPGTLPNMLRLGQAKELPEQPKVQKTFGKLKN
jgi:hypothetical protein